LEVFLGQFMPIRTRLRSSKGVYAGRAMLTSEVCGERRERMRSNGIEAKKRKRTGPSKAQGKPALAKAKGPRRGANLETFLLLDRLGEGRVYS
jgi:hypothetical protein